MDIFTTELDELASPANSINSKYVGQLNNITKLSKIVIPKVMKKSQMRRIGHEELPQIIQNNLDNMLKVEFGAHITNVVIPNDISELLSIYHASSTVSLLIKFLERNKEKHDYCMFNKIFITDWNQRIPLFYFQNKDSNDTTENNYMIIDLENFQDNLSDVFDKESYHIGKIILKYSTYTLAVGLSLLVLKNLLP